MIGYRTNISSLKVQRYLSDAVSIAGRAREKLASGLRINHASDDAAGLAIAETLRADIRIASQSIRNVNDGLSMLNIADGALEQLTSILTRGAELADQAANGVYSTQQRQPLHDEAIALVSELDRIANTTQFNDLKLLRNNVDPQAADKLAIITGLQSSWLQQAEQLIQTHYGIVGDGAPLEVVFVDNMPNYLAAVSGIVGAGGKIYNQQLLIDISDFIPATLPNGGTAPFYDDRIIAHEMVHAVMGRTMNFAALPTWFIEGTAEFIHGADERVQADIALNGGAGTGGEDAVADEIDQTWTGSSLQYSSGYTAVRYLHDRILTATGNGIKDIFDYLVANPSDDLDDALTNITNGAYIGGLTGFYADFKTAGNGSTFIQSMNLGNADTGAIGGADADGGSRVTTATGVIPDVNNQTTNPTTGFVESWPTISSGDGTIYFAVGLKGQDYLGLSFTDITADNLGVANVDLINYAQNALDAFKSAISTLVVQRGAIGATQSRLDSIVTNLKIMGENFSASESRIRDVDVASEAATAARADVLQRAATAVLAQANTEPQVALKLLDF